MTTTLRQRLLLQSKQRQKQHLHRAMPTRQAMAGPVITVAKQRYINFAHNDYLGLSQHPKVLTAFQQAARKYGVGSTASQWVLGLTDVHQKLKDTLAEWLDQPSATLFSCGFMANLGVLQALTHRHDVIFHDRENHASLIDAVRLTHCKHHRYHRHDPLTALTAQLKSTHCPMKWLVTDAVFSMSGAQAPLTQLAKIAQAQQTGLILDDAHGVGVLGIQGAGTPQQQQIAPQHITAHIIGFGKALGTMGGAVAGSQAVIECIEQQARTLAFTTAPPPALAAATLQSIELIRNQPEIRQKLLDNIAYFKKHSHNLSYVHCHDSPIVRILTKNAQQAHHWCNHLRQRGLWAHPVCPPAVPATTSGLRITLTAQHEPQHLDQLLETIHDLSTTTMLDHSH